MFSLGALNLYWMTRRSPTSRAMPLPLLSIYSRTNFFQKCFPSTSIEENACGSNNYIRNNKHKFYFIRVQICWNGIVRLKQLAVVQYEIVSCVLNWIILLFYYEIVHAHCWAIKCSQALCGLMNSSLYIFNWIEYCQPISVLISWVHFSNQFFFF